MRRIGILTSGGDAPGMNAAIRAAIRTALKNDLEIYGIEDGYLGLVQGKIFPLRYKDASEILTKGGTFLGSSRYPEFKEDAIQEKAVEQLRKRGIEGLVVIGGDGSYRGAQALMKKGVLCVGIPATIDNDVKGTDKTIGFSTAL
ncbi:MAG TPA: ATP-dependent 6-phosphofructokinase, partial [Kandleria vitulina]|nr:ATP-dependent 6-phosphofructokinase [Kandleria vitulina]